MKTWQKRTLWILGIAGVISAGGLFAFNLIMDKAISVLLGGQAAARLEAQLDEQLNQSFQLNVSGTSPLTDDPSSVAAQTSDSSDRKPQANASGNEIPPAGNQPKPDPNAIDRSYSSNVSLDKVKDLKENIDLTDKFKVASVLIAKFTPEQLSLFVEMASGGISIEEKKQAKKVFLGTLTEQEYDQLIAIAEKYGLSQGRSYSQSVKDEL